MPIKKHVNTLTVFEPPSNEMLSFITRSKRSHFTCSEAKLCEALEQSIYTIHRYFVAYVSFHPTVSVHVYGAQDQIKSHQQWLGESIEKTLKSLHDDGRDKIR